MSDYTSITIVQRGKYAEMIIEKSGMTWRLLLDEKSLSRIILLAREVLMEMRLV